MVQPPLEAAALGGAAFDEAAATGYASTTMQPLKAHVKNGRLLMDEPTELREGAEVELVVADEDFDAEERARLLAAIDAGAEDFERGDHVDGFELIAQMRAKREAASR